MTMEGDCRVLLDADTNAGGSKPTTPRVSAGSKWTMALLLLTLCLVAAAATAAVLVFNRQPKGRYQDEDSFDLHHTLRQISNVRAAIHLRGEYNPDVKTSVEWKNHVDQSYSQGGLELDNNEIVIPRDGLYFIYSQASFHISCSSDTESNAMVHLSHTVKRWSSTYGNDDAKRYYETILHTVRTACQKTAGSSPDQEGSWFSAVYMGAVFNLSRGDRLKTVMEEKMLSNLEDEPGRTFFGAFAL